MKGTRVAVLRGGPSRAYEISLNTGSDVLKALGTSGLYSKDVVISPIGEWLVEGKVRTPQEVLSDVDVAFLALHGEYGEDGTVQRILERLRVPYTGSGPFACGVTLNKNLTKARLKELGVTMPRHLRITRAGTTDVARTAQSIGQLFGPSYLVKPERGGSSIGTILARSEVELPQALSQALQESTEILVEERIIGKEATVATLENFRNEPLYLMPPMEVIPSAETGFYDTHAKCHGTAEDRCPGNFSRLEKDKLMAIAHKVHTALELRHYSQSDFIVAPDGVYFLEVNTLPRLGANALYPKALESVGCPYPELIKHLIALGQTTRR